MSGYADDLNYLIQAATPPGAKAYPVCNPDGSLVGSGGAGAVTANQGTPAADADAWPVKVPAGLDVNNFPATQAVTQSGIWTTGRTWQLITGTDSVDSVQSGVWTTGRTWALASPGDSVDAVQSGAWAVSVSNFPAIQPVSQSGIWSTGRTWALASGTDSVTTVPSGTQTVTGTVAATQSGAWTTGRTWALASGTDSVTIVPSGTQTITGTVAATQSGAWTTGRTWALASGTDSVTTVPSGTQTISGTVAATQSGAWSTGRTWTLASGTDSVTARLDGNAQPVDISTWTGFLDRFVMVGGLVTGSSIAGAAAIMPNTRAWLTTLKDAAGTDLGTITNPIRTDPVGTTTQPTNIAGWFGSVTPTVGQKTAAASIPVVLASDQTQLPAALVGGRLDTNNGAWLGSTAPTVGQKTMANSVPVVFPSDQTIPTSQAIAGTLANGAETAVAGSAIQVVAANASRKILLIQNTGVANVRIGITGVTATTGARLEPGKGFIFEMPYCTQQAIFAIREGAISSIVFAQETT